MSTPAVKEEQSPLATLVASAAALKAGKDSAISRRERIQDDLRYIQKHIYDAEDNYLCKSMKYSHSSSNLSMYTLYTVCYHPRRHESLWQRSEGLGLILDPH
jgi:hypothetical protein